jgi:Xaa-Pro aminopeptidase
MTIQLRSTPVPDFGVPVEQPAIPALTFETRCRTAYERAGCDWVIVYADREHFANIAFMSGFEPRFEEALLLLGPQDRRILVVGNENLSYTPVAGLPGLEVVLSQSLSLMAQDRTQKPSLAAVLRECGLGAGQTIGLVGWKYFEPEEWGDPAPGFFVPAFLVTVLNRIAGDAAAIRDVTPVLMHPGNGLRAIVDADQIASFEWAAARASAALWRIVQGVREGDSELEAASRMGYAGEALNCHMMLASSDAAAPVIGLRSPTARILRRGDGVSSAVSYWGGLSSRAGLITDQDDAFLETAKAYFEGLIAWYETADIGVAGGAIFERVVETLARGNLRSALNPGHLTGHDEWVHSPVRPRSTDVIASGMPFQVDIIPVPMPDGWSLNCEDAVTFADEDLRADLRARYPEVFARIEARRAFVRDRIGVEIRDSILPMSSTPLCLPPFWLAADRLLIRG